MKKISVFFLTMALAAMLGMTVACDQPDNGRTPPGQPGQPTMPQ